MSAALAVVLLRLHQYHSMVEMATATAVAVVEMNPRKGFKDVLPIVWNGGGVLIPLRAVVAAALPEDKEDKGREAVQEAGPPRGRTQNLRSFNEILSFGCQL